MSDHYIRIILKLQVGADVYKKVENLNLNEEQIVSGTSKDDLVGKGASSQSDIKSDQKNDAK